MQQILTVPSQLGPLLKAARKQSHLSQSDLADRVGLSQSRVSELELNPALINLEQLLAISGALGLEIAIGRRPEPATLPTGAAAAPAGTPATGSARGDDAAEW